MYNLKAILNELMDIDGLEVLAKPDKLIVSAVEDGTILCSVTKQKYMTYSDHYLYTGAINTIVSSNQSVLFDTSNLVLIISNEFGWKYDNDLDNRWIITDANEEIVLTIDHPSINTNWDSFKQLPLEQQHRVYQILGEHVK